MKRTQSPKLESFLKEFGQIGLFERDAYLTALFTGPENEPEELKKWRLAFNAHVITVLRERRLWPVKRWECPWEREEPEDESCD